MDTEKLKALALAATKGPWMRLFGERTVYDRMEDGCRGNAIVRADVAFSSQDANNLDFIAAANPATVLELCNENAELRAEVERLRAMSARNHATSSGGGKGFSFTSLVPDSSHVIPPTRGTGSQQDAGESVLSDGEIVTVYSVLAMKARNEGREPDTVRFARAIESAVASRFRAQGGSTSDKSSELIGSAPAAGTEKDAVIEAARRLVKAKGRYHTEQNYQALVDALRSANLLLAETFISTGKKMSPRATEVSDQIEQALVAAHPSRTTEEGNEQSIFDAWYDHSPRRLLIDKLSKRSVAYSAWIAAIGTRTKAGKEWE